MPTAQPFKFDETDLRFIQGRLYFAPFKTGTRDPKGSKPMGNAPEFNITVDIEELKHKTSTFGIPVTDQTVITNREFSASITVDDFTMENLAYFFSGDYEQVTQTVATVTDEAIQDVSVNSIYYLGVTDANPYGARDLDPTGFIVKRGATTLVEGTDYLVDAERGSIQFLTGAEGDDYTVTYETLATTYTRAKSGSSENEGSLVLESKNATGDDVRVRMPYVKLKPNGDLSMITTEFATIPLSIEILALPNKQPFYIDNFAAS